MRLAVEAAANGNTISWSSNGRDWVHIGGTFDSATVTLEGSPDEGATWTTLSADSVFTEAAWHSISVPAGVLLRAAITGGGGSEAIDIHVS